MERRQTVIAGNAHLYKIYKLDTPMCVNAAKEYDRIEEAKEVLRQKPLI